MNWAIWSAMAYDFPAVSGFTRGAVVELDRRHWALRVGLFQVPEEPNSDILGVQDRRRRGKMGGPLRALRVSPASSASAFSPTAAIWATITAR